MKISCHINKIKPLCYSYADAESGRIMEVRQQNGGSTTTSYTTLFLVKDHLGSVRAVTDNQGHVLERNSYYPFGLQTNQGESYPTLSSTITSLYPNILSATQTKRDLYNGKEIQTVAGTDYLDYGFRQYDPVTARWMAMDPIIKGWYSLYQYVTGNPVTKIDLLGLTSFIVNGERKEIDDGNYDLTIHVSEKDYKKLNKKFGKENKTSYYAFLDMLSRYYGFYTYNEYIENGNLGIIYTYHQPLKGSYGNWAIDNSDRVLKTFDLSPISVPFKYGFKVTNEKDITYAPKTNTFHEKYFGNQYEEVLRLKNSLHLKSIGNLLYLGDALSDISRIQNGLILDGNKVGYYTIQQISRLIVSKIGSIIGGDIGAVVGAELGPGAIVTSAVGAMVCSNFLNNNVEQLIEIILSF